MRHLRRSRRLLAGLAAAIMILSFAGTTLAVTNYNVNGLVYKNGNWTYYNTLRCYTGAAYPKLSLSTWAGDNANMYFFIRDTNNIALGDYTESSPLAFPIQNHDHAYRSFGYFYSSVCFKFAARKDGFIFASGTESWTGVAQY
jgi:hypothetical protein